MVELDSFQLKNLGAPNFKNFIVYFIKNIKIPF